MKKSLIALAIAATAGAAYAQSSVTLFGLVDVGYGQHKTTGPSNASIKSSGVMDGGQAGNRVGFRGTEKLAGGLTASFWIEQGVNISNDELFGLRAAAAGHQVDGFSASGSTAALSGVAGAYSQGTNRQSYVALGGGFGTVRLGYQYTNLYELATLSGYAIGSEGVQGADKAHLIRNDQFGGTRGNGITYISPAVSGVTVRAQIGGAAGRESVVASSAVASTLLTTDDNKRMSIMAQYAAGPLSVALAYTKMDVTLSARTAGTFTTTAFGSLSASALSASAAAAQDTSRKLTQIGGSYDLKVAKVGLVYNTGDNGTLGSDIKGLNISASMPFGKTSPFVSWGQSSVKTRSTGVKTEDYSMTQFGVRHSLSPRTTAYLMSGTTKNDAAGAAYNKDTKTVVGVAHSF